MIVLHPFVVTQSATVAGTATRLVATVKLVRSFQVQPNVGNTSPIYVGVAGSGKQPVLVTTANPLVMRLLGIGSDPVDFYAYDLADLYVLAGTTGDGVDVFGYA